MDPLDRGEPNESTCGNGVEALRRQIGSVCRAVGGRGSPRDASRDSPNLQDYSPFLDVSSALGWAALTDAWDLDKFRRRLPKLTFAPGARPEASPDDEDPGLDPEEEEEEEEEEEAPSVSFQSKYLHIFPLYQDYSPQDVRDDVRRLKDGLASDLVAPRCPPLFHAAVDRSSAAPLSSPRPRPAGGGTTRRLWQDLEEVKASGLLGGLTAGEVRLQESMFELIGSEASYQRSLAVAVDHFYASRALRRTLSRREHHILFSNIRQVKAASEKFLVDLEKRLGESALVSEVGDVVLQHCGAFRGLYVPYVTNMMYQENLIKQQLQQNRRFAYLLRTLEGDPVCQRQTLKSFLVLPFQRITRLKLLLETILKLTEPKSDAFSNLEKAITAIHEIVTDCDKGVRKMKQIEQLVCLDMMLDFSRVKAVPVIKSSRFLVHQGPLKQLTVENSSNPRTSFVGVHLHLFNDLLIVSLKKDQQRFVVADHAEFITHVKVENLKAEIPGLPPNAFLLRLAESQTGQPAASILVAQTKAEKETWLKLLSTEVSNLH